MNRTEGVVGGSGILLTGSDLTLGEVVRGARDSLEFHKPLRPGSGVEEAHQLIRESVPTLDGDRVLSGDMGEAARLVRRGSFSAIAADREN